MCRFQGKDKAGVGGGPPRQPGAGAAPASRPGLAGGRCLGGSEPGPGPGPITHPSPEEPEAHSSHGGGGALPVPGLASWPPCDRRVGRKGPRRPAARLRCHTQFILEKAWASEADLGPGPCGSVCTSCVTLGCPPASLSQTPWSGGTSPGVAESEGGQAGASSARGTQDALSKCSFLPPLPPLPASTLPACLFVRLLYPHPRVRFY